MYYHFRLVLFGLFYTFCMCIFLCTETISVYAICAVNIFSFVISYFGIKHMEHSHGCCVWFILFRF